MEQRMREIKERLQAAAPGAWKVWKTEAGYFGSDDPVIVSESGQYIAQTSYDGLNDRGTMRADAEFIAHAKEDIAFLLEELEKRLPKPNLIDGCGFGPWVNPYHHPELGFGISMQWPKQKGD